MSSKDVDSRAVPTAVAPSGSRLWRTSNGIERIFCAIHDQSAGCGRVVFLARFSGPRDEAAIEQALSTVSQRCQRAGLKIVQVKSGDYEFCIPDVPAMPPIAFRTVRNTDHGCEVAIEEGRQQFPTGSEPVLRWVVLVSETDDSFQIVGLAHHALFDAFSMALLLRRFLEVLGSKTIPEWEWPEPVLPRGQWSTFWKHLSRALPHTIQQECQKRSCQGLPRDEDGSGACIISRWTPEETDALTQACHEAESTVTAVLGVTGMQAVASKYGNEISLVDLVVPVNLRRYLPPAIAENTLGNVVVVKTFVANFRKPLPFVEQSRRIAAQLRDYVTYQTPLRGYHSINLIIPKRIKVPPQLPVCVSANSMGRFDFPESPSGVRMLECGWFANGGTNMPIFSQSAATIDHCLSITFYSVWLAPEHVRSLAAEVERQLREFAGLLPTAAVPATEALVTASP